VNPHPGSFKRRYQKFKKQNYKYQWPPLSCVPECLFYNCLRVVKSYLFQEVSKMLEEQILYCKQTVIHKRL